MRIRRAFDGGAGALVLQLTKSSDGSVISSLSEKQPASVAAKNVDMRSEAVARRSIWAVSFHEKRGFPAVQRPGVLVPDRKIPVVGLGLGLVSGWGTGEGGAARAGDGFGKRE
jgi:hypothetical protein